MGFLLDHELSKNLDLLNLCKTDLDFDDYLRRVS